MQRLVAPGGRRQRDQPRDLALAVENALALHLRGMRGEHRAHARPLEPGGERFLAAGLLQREREASATPRRAGFRVRLAPAVLVRVLGDIEQMREIAERPDHVQRLVDRQRIELRLQLRLDRRSLPRQGRIRLRPPEPHRGLADRLDLLPRPRPHLLADHVPQQPPEQPPILAEQVFLIGFVEVHFSHGAVRKMAAAPPSGSARRRGGSGCGSGSPRAGSPGSARRPSG